MDAPINISDDDDDVQLLSVGTQPKKISVPLADCELISEKQVERRTWCYGMILCPIMLSEPQVIPRMSVRLILYANPGHNWLKFGFVRADGQMEMDQMPVAMMPDGYCKLFTELMEKVKFEAFLDCQNLDRPFAKLLLYGSNVDALGIGQRLMSLRIALLDPDLQPKQEYKNPQHMIVRESPSVPLNVQQNAIVDQTKRQIERLYQSFTSPQNLDDMEQHPNLISPLFKYQRQALHWMYHRELPREDSDDVLFWKKERNGWRNQITDTVSPKKPRAVRGGILADDMGLGKTIQIISLILKGMPTAPPTLSKTDPIVPEKRDVFGFVPKSQSSSSTDDPNIGTLATNSTLIVCPLSLVHNWEDQILTHTRPDTLKVLVYHGQGRSMDPNYIKKFDVVITTYNIIGVGFGKGEISALHRLHWYRIVLDEAHIIKSSATIQCKAAVAFKAHIKWCLTGTPVQNKLDDLYSLIKFIKIEPLDRKAEWTGSIIKPITNARNNDDAFRKLQTLMRGITLRRVKTDLIDGKPILTLPERHERMILLDMAPTERQLYDKIHIQGKKIFEALKVKGSLDSSFALLLKAILCMRQACLHPSLVKFDDSLQISENSTIDVNQKLSKSETKTMFALLRENEEDNCIFCNTTVDGPGVCMTPCKHLICADCIDSQLKENGNCPMCRVIIKPECLQEVPESVLDNCDDSDEASLFSLYGNEGTKIGALISDLDNIRAQDYSKNTVTKSIVFSQFTTFLTLCQAALTRAGYKFARIDGRMTRQVRNENMDKFKNDPSVTIFLVSIKAGGVGLNLVSASRAYLMEPYWNPAVEQQAVDRVHRLGQIKEVIITRFIMRNSVEENMQERQKYKTALAQKALNEESRKRKRNADEILREKMKSLAILFH